MWLSSTASLAEISRYGILFFHILFGLLKTKLHCTPNIILLSLGDWSCLPSGCFLLYKSFSFSLVQCLYLLSFNFPSINCSFPSAIDFHPCIFHQPTDSNFLQLRCALSSVNSMDISMSCCDGLHFCFFFFFLEVMVSFKKSKCKTL